PGAPGESRQVGLQRLFVVVAQRCAGWQITGIDESASRQQGHAVTADVRTNSSDHTPVARDIGAIEPTHPGPPELAEASRRLRDDQHAAHGATRPIGPPPTPESFVPAATSCVTRAAADTTASLPMSTPGTTTAPAPTNAPASMHTSPQRITPGARKA